MEVNFSEEISSAVSKALILLSYASQEGIDIDNSVVIPIIDAKNAINSGEKLDAEDEKKFWVSFGSVSSAIKPINIASVIAVRDLKVSDSDSNKTYLSKLLFHWRKPISIASKSVRNYRMVFVITMFLMLLVQIYWVIGLDLINDAESIPGEIKRKYEKIDSLISKLGNAAADDPRISKLEEEAFDLDDRLDIRFNILVTWNQVWQSATLLNTNDQPEKFIINDKRKRFESALLKAKFTSGAIGRYILPLMYGLLGAFAFVLRRLSEAIKKLEYTKESNINFSLRLHLGALSGLAIGWFSGPVTDATIIDIGTLSPLALAFLAGYSVELLFTLMDRLIVKKD